MLIVSFGLGLTVGAALFPMAGRGSEPPAPQVGGLPSKLRAVHSADILRVIDGDTFEARVHVWPGLEITTKIRLRGIDAPELSHARCQQERDKAVAARDALVAILAQGDVGVSNIALDKYGGRVLADASTRGTPDISVALLGLGLVRGYSGGRREPWC